VVTVELTNSTAHHYVSAGTAFIPPMAIDQVVQYVVWGTVAGWTNYPIFQGTNAFTNPSWYYPVDLNSTYASQGWSPYYYSYSCPTGSVWINEINHFNYLTADQTNEYVEIIGPATTRLGDWKIVLLDNTRTEKNRCVISNSVVLENGYNGWGFFVCGDSGVANINHVLAPNPTYCMPNAGIIRLERSMGAWEDLVSYQQVLSVPGVPMSTAYAGAKPGFPSGNGCSSLGLTNTAYSLVNYGSNKADFAWSKFSAGSYTPGQRNANQMLRAVTNTVQYWFLTSVVGLHGTHSLSAVRVSVPSGSTQLVTYAADPWYRIQSFVTDGVTNQAAESAALFVWAVTNINRDYSNNVSFRLTLDGTENTNGVPSWWLASFGQTEQKSLDDADGVGVWQEYLLNQNPYVSNGPVRFTLEALAVTGTTVSATVRLLESTNGVYYPQPTIYGALYLQGTTNLNPGSWSDIATQTPGSVFDTNGRKLFTFPAQTNRFYKAQIR
jgi:hypothetical protein